MTTKILVVDDDSDVRDIVVMKLEIAGLETHTEEDGEAGLVAVREVRPDLALIDWMMPKMTGIEMCQRVRDEEETDRLPIILLTAKAQVADIQRGFAAGADDYMVKPFSPAELLTRVEALLNRRG